MVETCWFAISPQVRVPLTWHGAQPSDSPIPGTNSGSFTAGTTLATLPEGCQPTKRLTFNLNSKSNTHLLSVLLTVFSMSYRTSNCKLHVKMIEKRINLFVHFWCGNRDFLQNSTAIHHIQPFQPTWIFGGPKKRPTLRFFGHLFNFVSQSRCLPLRNAGSWGIRWMWRWTDKCCGWAAPPVPNGSVWAAWRLLPVTLDVSPCPCWMVSWWSWKTKRGLNGVGKWYSKMCVFE